MLPMTFVCCFHQRDTSSVVYSSPIGHNGVQADQCHMQSTLCPSASATASVCSFQIILRWICPLMPISFSSLIVELATKPLQSSTTGYTLAVQPHYSASADKIVYCSFFISRASLIASSQETIDLTIMAIRLELDQNTRSRCTLVTAISHGKVSL